VAVYLDDKKLVKQLLAGDPRAFNRFFDEHFARLYRFAMARMSQDPDAARDVVQQTLTKAMRKLGSWRGESALFTWLCAICRNEMSDWLANQGRRGARIVARAWCDPEVRQRLFDDAPAAIDELGYLGKATAHLRVVENTDRVHNLVVCTLCSCYPFSILGIAPAWYKAAAYRSRAVRDPRGVLAEFGVDIGDDVEVRVWDSTAELRYLVLPQRPPGSDGMSEEELAALVSRNSMIGTDRDLKVGAED